MSQSTLSADITVTVMCVCIKGRRLFQHLLGHIPSLSGRDIIHLQLQPPSHFLFLEMGASPVSLSLLCVCGVLYIYNSAMCVFVCARADVGV